MLQLARPKGSVVLFAHLRVHSFIRLFAAVETASAVTEMQEGSTWTIMRQWKYFEFRSWLAMFTLQVLVRRRDHCSLPGSGAASCVLLCFALSCRFHPTPGALACGRRAGLRGT